MVSVNIPETILLGYESSKTILNPKAILCRWTTFFLKMYNRIRCWCLGFWIGFRTFGNHHCLINWSFLNYRNKLKYNEWSIDQSCQWKIIFIYVQHHHRCHASHARIHYELYHQSNYSLDNITTKEALEWWILVQEQLDLVQTIW